MEEFKYEVYVKIDPNNVIIQIESSISPIDFSNGWVLIDEGVGDKYSHAQGNYFPKEKPLRDMQGKCNYKLVNGKVVELTNEEKATLFPTPVPQPTSEEILRSKLIKDNASMQLQLIQQQKLNADILLKIAKLGGTTNV